MTDQEVVDQILKLVENTNSIETSFDDPVIKDLVDSLRKASLRFKLVKEHNIIVDIFADKRIVKIGKINMDPNDTVITKTVTPEPTVEDATTIEKPDLNIHKRHKYIPPPFYDKIQKAIKHPSSLIGCFVGPTGSGKTELAELLANDLDMEMVKVCCKKDMDTASFLGDKTVDVDRESMQNYIKFLEGPVTKAMQIGLDKDGNETGRPALLIIDEFPIIPAWIAIGLNNLMDSFNPKRKVVLDGDGGRVVTSHSGFRILLLGNTVGKGLTGMNDSLYVAQGDALDASTLDRIDYIFKFGYNRKAEESILREKIGNDKIVKKVLEFRDAIRDHKKRNPQAMRTPFSTRAIVTISNLYRVWGSAEEAIWYGVINKLPVESEDQSELAGEQAIYNEQAMAVFGKDLHKEYGCFKDMDF